MPFSFVAPAAFLLAFTIRVIFVVQWAGTPYGGVPFLDAQAYDDWAKLIASGELFRAGAFYQAPLYPYVLGLFYRLFGHDLLLAGLLNAAFDAGAVALLTSIAGRCYGNLTAVLTALFGTFFAPALFYVAPIMKEPLALFLLSLFLFFALRFFETFKTRDALASGVFLGVAALTRGNVLLLALPFLFMVRNNKRAGLIFIAALLLCLAPAALHNAAVSRSFIPVSYADGFNFYIGWGPYANGVNSYPPEVSTDPIQEERAATWEAEKEVGRALRASEVSSYWRERALAFMFEHPAHTFVLFKNKLEAFWNNARRFDNYDAAFIRENFDTLLSWPFVDFWVIAALAAFSVVALWKNDKTTRILFVFAVTYMFSVLLFYVTDRYRLPIIVFLMPLAGTAVAAGASLIKEKNRTRLSAAAATAFVFLFLGLRPDPFAVDLRAFNWGMLAMLYEQQGKPEETLSAFEKGRAISEKDVGAGAYIRASYALFTKNRLTESEALLRQAAALFPNDGIISYNLGRLKAFEGKLGEALAFFTEGQEKTPYYSLNYLGQASILERQGRLADAHKLAVHGLDLDPKNEDLSALYRRTSSGSTGLPSRRVSK